VRKVPQRSRAGDSATSDRSAEHVPSATDANMAGLVCLVRTWTLTVIICVFV